MVLVSGLLLACRVAANMQWKEYAMMSTEQWHAGSWDHAELCWAMQRHAGSVQNHVRSVPYY